MNNETQESVKNKSSSGGPEPNGSAPSVKQPTPNTTTIQN